MSQKCSQLRVAGPAFVAGTSSFYSANPFTTPFGHSSMATDPWTLRERSASEQVNDVIASMPHEADQLDAIAKIRGWYDSYGPANIILNQYMGGGLDVQGCAERLAAPIDELWTNADNGRAFYDNEMVARSQRGYYDAEEAEERWGLEQDFPEPEEDDDDSPSLEGKLWDLWYAVMHASRKIHWADEPQQSRLIDLMKALKARPDPPLPECMTVAMRRDWIYASGDLWSNLTMLGPSARETWNDSPGCGAGFSAPELNAWANTNAFVARLTVDGLADYWNYGSWAMRDALEDVQNASWRNIIATLPAANAWMHIAGRQIWAQAVANALDDDDVDSSAETAEAMVKYDRHQDRFTRNRWQTWRRKLGLLQEQRRSDEQTKKLAGEMDVLMQQIESETASE